MKLATYLSDTPRLAAVQPGSDRLVDLQHACFETNGQPDAALQSMQSLIDSGRAGLELAASLVRSAPEASCLPIDSVRLLAPIEPRALRCCSVFDGHHYGVARALRSRGEEANAPALDVPALFKAIPGYYKASHLNVRGPDDVIEWPAYGDDLDFELEMAAVIGLTGKDVPADQALNHIFGYTIYNDVSARRPQLTEMSMGLGPVKSKDFDGANILGPYIVTSDEFDGDDVLAIARINGEEIGRSRSSGMRQNWAQIVSYRSLGETMHPGEVITSGAFTGCSGIEHLRFLASGEVVELEIEGIGTLKNQVGARPAQPIQWPDYPSGAPSPVHG